MIYKLEQKKFWLDEAADALLTYLASQGIPEDEQITCAAGMTPSCPIHFGIFREIAISAFIADELRRRKKNVRLVYYWDDFDHFCKIPYYAQAEDIKQHIGQPLRTVPDFDGNYASYGEHYMRSFEKNLHTLGIFPQYNYQSDLYTSGYYVPYIKTALKQRRKIFDIICEVNGLDPEKNQKEREAYFPVEVYCGECGKDAVTVNSFDEEKNLLSYTCRACHHSGAYTIDSSFNGKLIWKANWALRWADDKVRFESSGENQLTDTGSYPVASRIAVEVFNARVPFSLLYLFIGAPGTAKISRHMGETALAERFVDVLEPHIIRWILIKNSPIKPITVDIGSGIGRVYHEWDSFAKKIHDGSASAEDKRIYAISVSGVEVSRITIPFKTIITALTLANGDIDFAVRLLIKVTGYNGRAEDLHEQAKPRITAAHTWLYKYGNIKNEPALLTQFNESGWNTLTDTCKDAIRRIYEEMTYIETEELLLERLYAIPKEVLGVAVDAPLTAEQKKFQKEVFSGMYLLLFGTNRGPKLSTLLYLLDNSKLTRLLRGRKYE